MNSAAAYRWDGEVFRPLRPKQADAEFVVGQVHWLAEVADTSSKSMAHEFAWLRDAWANLPESIAESYPSPEHLRKRALIEGGFFDEQIVDAGSNAAAIRVASAMRAIDDFALVFVRGAFVIRRTAKSQSRRAMKHDEFQKSKTAVMEIVASMIGVRPDRLAENAGGAA